MAGRRLRIGIMSQADFQKYTIAIARGKLRRSGQMPKVWFDSVESMAQVLSSRNRELLRTIQERKPESLKELASISGRHVSNLSRTLKTMERYGIVKLQKTKGAIKPSVRVSSFQAVFGF
jgi:predicted transcriptional regulator